MSESKSISNAGCPHSEPLSSLVSSYPQSVSAVCALHEAYTQLTGFEIVLDAFREASWGQFLARGFTVDDMRLVIYSIRKGIESKERKPGALKFRNLIGNLDWFEEDLAEIRAKRRGHVPIDPAKAEVLRATGRSVTASNASTVTTVGAVLKKVAPELTEEGKKAMDAFSALKSNL